LSVLPRPREKVFGPGRAIPLDRNAKARILAYARAWSRRNAKPGHRTGPVTRAFLDVLRALLWGFHNSRTGCCFPSYERIAERAECARSTVAEALKALEFAGMLTWQHRITRIREHCRDLFGHGGWRWRVIRTSNAYCFRDPASKSENRTGTQNQEFTLISALPAGEPDSPLERAITRLAETLGAKMALKEAGAAVPAK
jgi:hypothetical protein